MEKQAMGLYRFWLVLAILIFFSIADEMLTLYVIREAEIF